MSLADAFAPAEAEYRERVIQNTWGHLAPVDRRIYRGTLIYTWSAYGDIVPIRCDFEGLPDSPWFFDAMNEFISDSINDLDDGEGHVFRFEGTYRRYKNGRSKFAGTTREVPLG